MTSRIPTYPFTISGGCNCGAVRYRVNVPAHKERKPMPYKTNDADIGDLRLPANMICHCNNCRAASSGIILACIAADFDTIAVSVAASGAQQDAERVWRPATEIFDKPAVIKDTTSPLAVYESSPLRSRWFCRVCGTQFGYSIDLEHPAYAEWGWPPMFDIYMGTVDRADLEKDWMMPERRMWCEPGVPWIRRLIAEGTEAHGLTSHPTIGINEVWKEPV